MPLDFLKILSKDKEFAESLYNNPILKKYSSSQKFSNNLDKENNTIKQATYIKSYKEILFCFFTKKEEFTKLEILIKPHYYFNDNLHNANDFKAFNCIQTLTEIKEIFDFPSEELSTQNIEFGINGLSPIDCMDLISYSIFHEKNEFINSSDNLRFSKISFKHRADGKANRYKQIKFYAKGLQFPQYAYSNTFRFEVKSKESKYIKKLGIKTYDDLLKIETYHKLADKLRSEFKNVLILDIDNNGQNLTNKELLKLNEHKNTYVWVKRLQHSRNVFTNNKKKYFELLDKTGNNIHVEVFDVIDIKLQELLKPCAISTPPNKLKMCAVSDVYIIGNRTLPKLKLCPITGIDLSQEKQGSKYIKTTTINYLRKYNVEVYQNLCSMFLPKNGKRPKFESDIVSHMCKNIRNRYYNPITIKQTGYRAKRYDNQLALVI
jgi:hypothetical protein